MQNRNLTPDENRIAQAVASAVMEAMELRLANFEQRMDERFTAHMEELEGYYSNHYSELLSEVRALRKDYKKAFGD